MPKNIKKMKYEDFYEECLSFIRTVDTYLREITEDNLEDYEEFHPFVDEEDILLYRSLDESDIIDMTTSLFLKSNLNIKKKELMFYAFICSYVLVLKYHTDCTLYKAYSCIIEILRSFEDLVSVSKLLANSSNDKTIIKNLMNMEWKILNNVEFKV